MKKITILSALLFFFVFTTKTFAQDNEIKFGSCNDEFTIVSLDYSDEDGNFSKGVLTIVVKATNPPSAGELAEYGSESVSLSWFFGPRSTEMEESRPYKIADIQFSWQQGANDAILMNASAKPKLLNATLAGSGYVLFVFELSSEQVAILNILNGLPDKKTEGFELTNLFLMKKNS